MITRALASLSIALVGLYAGGLLFFTIAPSVASIPDPAYLAYWQALNHDYLVLPPFLIAATLSMIVLAIRSRRRRPVALVWALAAALFVASIVVTVGFMLPINTLADGWSAASIPAEFGPMRETWLGLHRLRTVLGMSAFGAVIPATQWGAPAVIAKSQEK